MVHVSSSQAVRATQDTRSQRHAKEPPVFEGNQIKFRQCAFSVDLALRSLFLKAIGKMVEYAAGYLEGNANLWLILFMDSGITFSNWEELREALSKVYTPLYDQ